MRRPSKTLLVSALSVALWAGAPAAFAEEESPSETLGGWDNLGEQTRIATRTRLNVDYAPGTVTLLHGRDLQDRGARTVWEALEFVPGFELSTDEVGTRQLLVRGVGKTYSSGNVKILLDDVPQNSELLSLANPVLNLPLEQVERIEAIRGPGSAIYGHSAYMGVINVVTRQSSGHVFAGAGSFGQTVAGGIASISAPEQDFHATLNLSASRRGATGVQAGQDWLHTPGGLGTPSFSPGPPNDPLEQHSALLTVNLRRFTLLGQWLEDGAGDHFGINHELPPDNPRIVTRHRHRSLELRHNLDLAPNLQAEWRVGGSDFEHARDNLFVDTTFYLSRHYREKRLTAAGSLAWEQGKHTLLAGWNWNRVHIASADWSANFPGLPANWIEVGRQRVASSLTLQDEYRATETFTLTGGLRHDRYDDVGSSTTPRLAGVWQVAPGHILKAQYAQAFRAPTFFEQRNGGLPSMEPETVTTTEAGYAFRDVRRQFRATLFHSAMRDLIAFGDDPAVGYYRISRAYSRGFEIEGEYWLGDAIKLSGSLSHVGTWESVTGRSIPGAAERLANLGLEYLPSRDHTLALNLRHVGNRPRAAADLRPPLSGYTRVDVTARALNFGMPGLTLRAGVRNLLDADIRVPAPLVLDLLDTRTPGYAADLPTPDREWWAQASYSF